MSEMPFNVDFSKKLMMAPVITKYAWGVKRFTFSITKNNYDLTMMRHIHNYLQLWYVRSGFVMHYCSGMSFNQKSGSIFIVPPFFEHILDAKKNTFDVIACDFSESFWASALDDVANNSLFKLAYLAPLLMNLKTVEDPCLYFSKDAAIQIEQLLDEIQRQYTGDWTYLSQPLRENIKKLLTLIVQEYESNLTPENEELFLKYHAAIQTTFDYINTHYTEKVRLETVCKKALMSTSAFSYIFRQLTGKTLIKYVYQLRILRACELLVSTDLPMYEISCDCGFGDPTNFCRVFHSITGYQPSIFRSIWRIGSVE